MEIQVQWEFIHGAAVRLLRVDTGLLGFLGACRGGPWIPPLTGSA